MLATSSTSTLQTYRRIDLITSVSKQYNPDGSPISYTHQTFSVPFFTFIVIVIASLIVASMIAKIYFFNKK